MKLQANTILNHRYQILDSLGQGGFGITYLALDTELKKKVCIKELFVDGVCIRQGDSVTITESKRDFPWAYFIDNFKKEAQKIAEFRHYNIVSVSSVFEANGTAYYVMEYVEGETLKSRMQQMGRAFTAEELKPIINQLFDAVDELHNKGLLHRDLKPDNIMIEKNDRIILIDFGSARENMDEKTATLISNTTLIFLTHGYAAPEMYSTTAIKGRYTDIYSLGATLYYLLTNQKPVVVNDRHLGENLPAPHELNPQISEHFSSAIMRALELKKEQRFKNVADFRAAMTKEEKPKPPVKTVLIITGIALVVIVTAMVFILNSMSPSSQIGFNYEVVDVAGGTFRMGCTSEQGWDCGDDENPVHQVSLSSFQIGKYEVTQAQWEALMGSNPSNFKACPNCPVEQVSWNDVQQFISKLNLKTGKTYRLPTEAEWEYAARGANNRKNNKYAGSAILDDVAWYDGNSENKTHPVGKKNANELGIHDMSGNVWEWCNDWYELNYYNASPIDNPSGPASGSYRVLRGGSWGFNPQSCRVSGRDYGYPDYRHDRLGFRLVLAP